MRTLPLKAELGKQGAEFAECNGVETVARCADFESEYTAVRDAVALTDFSFMQMYRVPEETGIDFLDSLVAGNVAKIRFGRVLHSFIADESGAPIADCYVANNDDEFILLCESIVSDEELDKKIAACGGGEAGIESLHPNHVCLGIDGFTAYKVAKELFGTDVLGLPYMSIEIYSFEGHDVRLIRGGKTSEFGYLMCVEASVAQPLFSKTLDLVSQEGGRLVGLDIHKDLRLEGRFFNIYAEGARVKDPLTLGLQWMIDFDKDEFSGSGAIMEKRAAGLREKMVGVALPEGERDLEVGESILDGTEPVGTVVASCFSPVRNCGLGLVVLPVDLAYTGVSFTTASGKTVSTISMPPIMPKSLGVKLDEM